MSYTLICILLGLGLAWLPLLVHGPIPYKLDAVRLDGSVAVWGSYSARLMIGVLVGLSGWPSAWYLRGPLCGVVMILPVSLFALATPGCGAPCMSQNLLTSPAIGLLVAGIAYMVTGKSRP